MRASKHTKLTAGLLALALAGPSLALWVELSDEELIAQSALIVEGEIVGHTQLSASAQESVTLAVLQVAAWHKGRLPEDLVLLHEPARRDHPVSTDIRFQRGQRGLWLLRTYDDGAIGGVYAADHPQRYLPYRKAERVARLLGLLGD